MCLRAPRPVKTGVKMSKRNRKHESDYDFWFSIIECQMEWYLFLGKRGMARRLFHEAQEIYGLNLKGRWRKQFLREIDRRWGYLLNAR